MLLLNSQDQIMMISNSRGFLLHKKKVLSAYRKLWPYQTSLTGDADEFTFEIRVALQNDQNVIATVALSLMGFLYGLYFVFEK